MTELEVCCADVNSLLAAKAGGAQRIELCSALADGGLTPSAGLIKAAREMGFEKINVLIRERGGDFLYNRHELKVMEEDVRMAVDLGASGIVWGALLADGSVDTHTLALMRRAAGGADFTFHRAFDVCRNASEALEAVVECGCTCILTSGLAATAMEGMEQIRALVEQASGRIAIMAGAGVNSTNCGEIVRQTGVRNIHSSAKRKVASGMKFFRDGVAMGENEVGVYETDSNEVRAILERIR